MKKNVATLAFLGALASNATAQSSVAIYGIVDLSLAKPIGSSARQLADNGGGAAISRLGFTGVEDLGGGWAAIFGLEHRFLPDTGEGTPVNRYWQGFSTVGLRGPLGTVNLGRQYTAAFSLVQNQIDPFAADGQAQSRDYSMRPFVPAAFGGRVEKVRVSDSVRYDFSTSGFNFAANIATAAQEAGTTTGPNRPWSVAANYRAGPLFIGMGYENPQGANDELLSVGITYKVSGATLAAGYSGGKTDLNREVRGWLLGASYVIGVGTVMASYGRSQVDDALGKKVTTASRFGVGYDHILSKRTKLYVHYGYDGKATTIVGSPEKSGYDIGIRHAF